MTSAPNTRALARELALLKRERLQRKQPNLGFSTIDGGALQAADQVGNLTMIVGQQFDGTNTAAVVSGPTPPTPTVPLVTVQAGSLRVYWDGTFEDGQSAPMDFARVLVYAEPLLSYTGPEPLNQTIIVGGLTSATGGEVTAALDAGTEYVVYLVCWSLAGKPSLASAVATGIPGTEIAVTEPPPASPALAVVGMPDAFLLRTEGIAATTLLTYQVLLEDGVTWETLAGTPIRSTILVAKESSEGPFQVGVTYQFRVIAGNGVLPDPPPSDVVEGQLDTSRIALIAQQLISEEVIAGFALFGAIEVGGDTFTLTPPGLYPDDPERDKGGLRIELLNNGLIHLPADGSAPKMLGMDRIEVENLEVDGIKVQGYSELGGQIEIGASIKDPTEAPDVSIYYQSVAPVGFALSGVKGFARNLADDGWIILNGNGDLVVIDDSGAEVDRVSGRRIQYVSGSYRSHTPVSVTQSGGYYQLLCRRDDNDAMTLFRLDSSLSPVDRLGGSGPPMPKFTIPSTTGWTSATIGPSESTSDSVVIIFTDGTNTVMRDYVTTTAVLTSQVTLAGYWPGSLGGAYRGSGDFGGSRWVLQSNANDVDVYNVNVLQPSESWPRAAGESVRGLWWDGTHFWTGNSIGRIRRLETAASAPSATYWLSYTWVDADTHATAPSPQKSIARPKRSSIRVQASAAPQESAVTGGPHLANQIQVYAATSSGGTKRPQGSALAVGTRSVTLTSIATSGTAPGANNWAGIIVPGEIYSSQGGYWVNGNSDGDVGTGSFRDSVDTVPAGRVQRITAQSMVFNDTTPISWNQINFLRDGMTSSSAGLTVPKAGLYDITAQAGLATDNASGGIMHIVVTGSTVQSNVVLERGNCATSGGITLENGATLIECAAGDTLSLSVFHTNGANRNLQVGAYETSISAVYRGPA